MNYMGVSMKSVVLHNSPNTNNAISSGVKIAYRKKGLLVYINSSHKPKLIVKGEK